MKHVMDKRERPLHAVGEYSSEEDISELLPILGRQAGFELRSVTFILDPVVLYNKFGQVLYEWECGYEPSWPEVYEVCSRFIK